MHPSFSNSVQHKPSSRLGYFNISMQFHAGHTFQTGKTKINGYYPFLHRNFGIGYWGVRLYTEIATTIRTPIRHFLMTGFCSANRTAIGAVSAIRPNNAFKPKRRGPLIREHGKQLDKRYAVSVILSRCFFHNLIFISSMLSCVKLYQK